MAVAFGRAFTRSFSVLDGDGNLLSLNSIVSARLYTSKPSEAQIEDSAAALGGFLQNVTSWAAGTATNEKVITYTALTDDDEHNTGNATYWEVVNFRFDAAGAIKFVARPFTVVRPNSLESRISITYSDVSDLESDIYNADGTGLKSAAWVTARITKATRFTLLKLKGDGLLRARLKEGDLDDAVLFQSTALCCLGLSSSTNDIWSQKYELYKEAYENVFKQEPVGYDANADGLIEPQEAISFGSITLER